MIRTYLLFFIVYSLLLLLVSIIFSRRMKNLEDFFLASRNLPFLLVYFSLTASWIGASSTLVSVDEAFSHGFSSVWIMGLPTVITVAVFAFVLAGPIRKLPIITLPDLVEMRYGRIVRHMTAVLIVWYMTLLAASQMTALGSFLMPLIGKSYFLCILLGTSVVLVYSILGGFFSVALTDGFQFIFLSVGFIGLLVFLNGKTSLSELQVLIDQYGRSEYFNVFYEVKRNLWILISFTLAWIISPIVWQRIQASRTDHTAKKGLIAAGATFVIFYGMILVIGMLAWALYRDLPPGQNVLSLMISSKTNLLLGGIIFTAISAAIMSTLDTAVNTGAMSLTRDIVQRMIFPGGIKRVLLVSRSMTFLITGVALLIASQIRSILLSLGLASEIMTVGFFIPGIAMIFMREKAPMAGFLSLFLGILFSLTGFLSQMGVFTTILPEWPFSVPYGLLLSLLGFILGLMIDRIRRQHVN
ncbi:MAG: sodium:solute symporter family protein [Candidatus Aminicenantes bacterium]|nr:sodium:solute symporter family protein [Candidatus Aminicenantes bacterium]